MMSEQLTFLESTSSPEDSPASPSASPAISREKTITVGSGRTCSESYARLTPDGYWSRMLSGYCQLTLDGSLAPLSETWPRSGWISGGIAYRQPPLVHRISEIESGSWRTPQSRDGDSRGAQRPAERRAQGHSVSLEDQVMFPTPTAQYGTGQNGQRGDGSSYKQAGKPSLHTMALHNLWPRTQACYPTPDANCWKGGSENQRKSQLNGRLNPTWVEWLMGFPLGWTDLDVSATRWCPPLPSSTDE